MLSMCSKEKYHALQIGQYGLLVWAFCLKLVIKVCNLRKKYLPILSAETFVKKNIDIFEYQIWSPHLKVPNSATN